MPPLIDRNGIELNPRLPLGRTLTLFCEAKGEPEPFIRWFINNTEITKALNNNNNIIFGKNQRFIQLSIFKLYIF